jgi:hypothetical protein
VPWQFIEGNGAAAVYQRCAPVSVSLADGNGRGDPGAVFSEFGSGGEGRLGVGRFTPGGGRRHRRPGRNTYGSVTLLEDGPAWLSLAASGRVLRKQAIDPATQKVTFTLDHQDLLELRVELHARAVSAEDGKPLACRAHLGPDLFPRDAGVEVDAAGLVHFAGQMPGEHWLELRAPVAIAGLARTPSGDPVQGSVRCGVQDGATGEVRWDRWTSYRSDNQGAFRLADLEPGIWMLHASGSSTVELQSVARSSDRIRAAVLSSQPVRVDVRLGSAEEVELVLTETTRITVECEVVTPPLPGLVVLDADGLETAFGRHEPRDGTFGLNLLPGRYGLLCPRAGCETVRRELLVDGDPQTLHGLLE